MAKAYSLIGMSRGQGLRQLLGHSLRRQGRPEKWLRPGPPIQRIHVGGYFVYRQRALGKRFRGRFPEGDRIPAHRGFKAINAPHRLLGPESG